MSFQFSQNLLADLQSQSPNSSQSLPATQQILPPSQNVSQPLTSQSQCSLPQSENLLENQSLDFFPYPQPNIKPSRPKFPRSKSSQSFSQQPQPTILGSRVPYSRLNQGPPPLNISLANSLKQVQRRLDDFPVQIAKMLEEGFDYLQTEARKQSSQSQESCANVRQVLEKIQTASKEKDDWVKKVLEDCTNELKDYEEEIKKQKLVRDKYEEVIQVMKEIIDKQTAEIDRLKKERMIEKSGQGSLRVKSDNELLESHILKKKQKPSLLSPSITLLPRAFTRPPLTIASQSSSSSSESRNVRQFSLLDDLMLESDSDEEAEIDDNSPGLGVDFSELIAISDSEEEEVMMVDVKPKDWYFVLD